MTRRHSSIVALVALIAAFAVLVSACGGSTPGPTLTDPTAIITAALTSTKGAKSVRIDGTMDGKATIALPFAGRAAAPVDLTGATVSADLDMTAGSLRATFAAPGLLDVAGELIEVDRKGYLKTTLTGVQYRPIDVGRTLPLDPTGTSGFVAAIGDLLLAPGVDPVKGSDVTCGPGTCYSVSADLSASKLGAILGPTADNLPIDLAGAGVSITMWVEQSLPYHLAGIAITVTMADRSKLKLDLTFSKWDVPVSIGAPPADQVKPTS